MNLYKTSYLPKIESPIKITNNQLNFCELKLNDNQQNQSNKKLNKTNSKFKLAPKGRNINLFSKNSTFTNRSPYINQNKRNVSLVPEISNKKTLNTIPIKKRSNSLNFNGKKINNIKECPLCHTTMQMHRFSFHYHSHPSQILPWLFLGCYRNASNKKEIKQLNIKYVLNCAFECNSNYPNDIKYKHLKLSDNPTFRILNFIDNAADFINEAKNENCNILVHCQMGISRSTTCVIAYMVKYLKYNVIDALQFIKKRRSIVMPNYGFLNQLIRWEKTINKQEN